MIGQSKAKALDCVQFSKRRETEMSKKWTWALATILILAMVLSACGAHEPEMVGGFEIPAIEKDAGIYTPCMTKAFCAKARSPEIGLNSGL